MKTDNQKIGNDGENIATSYLIKKGYTILDTNWRYGHLEVDIIAEYNGMVVFCEVKTRTSNTLGSPEQFVTKQKQNNLIRAANFYFTKKHCSQEVRFDIIGILQKGDKVELTHMEDAFQPSW